MLPALEAPAIVRADVNHAHASVGLVATVPPSLTRCGIGSEVHDLGFPARNGVFSTPFVAAPSLFTNDVVWTFWEVHIHDPEYPGL